MPPKDKPPQSDPYAYRAAGRPVAPTASQSYTQNKKQGRGGRAAKRFVIMLVAVCVMLGLAFTIVRLLEKSEPVAEAAGADSASGPQANIVEYVPPEPEPEPEPPTIDNSGWNVSAAIEGATVVPLTSPSSHMLALPENGRVDISYFDTAVFVGDSLTQGLQIYTEGLPNAKYCAYKGISPKQVYDGSIQTLLSGAKEVPMDALAAHQPDNVYVLLGTNAMVGMADEPLLAYYSEMLDHMKAVLHPEVDIYVQSITPVVQGRDARFDFNRIAGLNDALALMALEKGLYFLDLHEALAGDDGWMRIDFGARDGYHMKPSGYAAWVDYLMTHTAYNPRHAHLYQEGDHYYSQSPPAEEA